jgi:hypothetical protein
VEDVPSAATRRAAGTRRPHAAHVASVDPTEQQTARSSRLNGLTSTRPIGHHGGEYRARLGIVKALRFAPTRERAHGLDDASVERGIGSCVMAVVKVD